MVFYYSTLASHEFFFFLITMGTKKKKQMSAMPQETGHVCHCSARAKVSLYLGAGFRHGAD